MKHGEGHPLYGKHYDAEASLVRTNGEKFGKEDLEGMALLMLATYSGMLKQGQDLNAVNAVVEYAAMIAWVERIKHDMHRVVADDGDGAAFVVGLSLGYQMASIGTAILIGDREEAHAA